MILIIKEITKGREKVDVTFASLSFDDEYCQDYIHHFEDKNITKVFSVGMKVSVIPLTLAGHMTWLYVTSNKKYIFNNSTKSNDTFSRSIIDIAISLGAAELGI
jgi:hypothetical protein